MIRKYAGMALAMLTALCVCAAAPAQDTIARGLALQGKARASAAQVAGFASGLALGDSLTQGTGAQSLTAPWGKPYPDQLSVATGIPFTNFGIGGTTSTEIMSRLVPLQFTVTGNVIPPAGAGVLVTAINGVSMVGQATNSSVPFPLSTPGTNQGAYAQGTLCGFHGNLRRSATGGPPSTSETYTFIPDSPPTINISCPSGSPFKFDATASLSSPTIIWAGRNNYTNPATVKADIATMVATLTAAGNTNYLVLSVINGQYPLEIAGQSAYATIAQLNSDLAAIYGSRFVDVRTALVAAYNASSPADVIDHANDVPPQSLRSIDSSGTLTTASIDTATCTFTLSTAPPTVIQFADGEMVKITASTGTNITGCVRGYASTTAAAKVSGAAWNGWDNIHLNGAGYGIVAASVQASLKPLLAAVHLNGVPVDAAGVASATSGATIGTLGVGFNGNRPQGPAALFVNGPIQVGTQSSLGLGLYGVDLSTANPINLIRNINSHVYVGGLNSGDMCLGTGYGGYGATLPLGSSGACYLGLTNHGSLYFAGPLPVLSACGTSTLDANANHMSGTISFVGSPTSCTMTWTTSYWLSANHCTIVSGAGQALAYTYNLTAMTITFAGGMTGKADYRCDGQ